MDSNNWRPIHRGEPSMDSTDWRNQLQPDSRQRIVNKIMDTLKKHFSGHESLLELEKLAERLEEKVYTAATSQTDYLRKLSLRMLSIETNIGEHPMMDTTDWRNQLQPNSRQRIVNKIINTLERHLPFSGKEGLQELKKLAEGFEEKIYTAATSQSDYSRKITLKMLTVETKSQNNVLDALPYVQPHWQ